MKKIVTSLLAFAFLQLSTTPLTAQTGEYVLNGRVEDQSLNGTVVYLQGFDINRAGLTSVVDSTTVVDYRFAFREPVSDSLFVRIVSVGGKASDRIGIFAAEEGTIEMIVDNSAFSVGGTQRNDEYQAMTDSQAPLFRRMQELRDEAFSIQNNGEDNNSSMQKSRVEEYAVLLKQLMDISAGYVGKNMTNNIGEFLFLSYSQLLDADHLKNLYEKSNPGFKASPLVSSIMQTQVWSKENTEIGKEFADIELPTIEGKKGRISSYKGKVVLVDFWASWCMPCIREIPVLKAVYNEFKDKGFEIIGISLDENRASWVDTVRRRSMDWVQMSDLGGWRSAAARQYNVTSIPQTFLLDKEGKIAGVNLRGDALKAKIEELLK